MSPASSGSLEIERYIGACLISSHQNRQQNKSVRDRVVFPNREQQFFPEVYHRNRYCIQRCGAVDGWAGGVPLISFAQRRNNNRQVDVGPRNDEQQQYTPLARLAVHTQGAPLILTGRFHHKKNKGFKNAARIAESRNKSDNVVPADAVSVASDESSGSANSENCLPRIIKPRKRRKKDRKPLHLARPLTQDGSGFSTDSTSPDILDCPSPGVVGLTTPYASFAYDYQNQTSLSTDEGYYNETSEIPRLHHSFEDVEEAEDASQQSECQCRICDPSGFIWNVDRNCYSPFLTAPRTSLEFKMDDLSSKLSSIALNESFGEKSSRVVGSGDLEVSTEIITSPNGHRDLEIKFFSSSAVEKVGKVLVNHCVDYLLSADSKNES